MLESITFEFDTRHPQQALMNVLQLEFSLSLDDPADKKIIYTAWEIGMDLNLTFALLKQSAATMAIACAELAMRLCGRASDVEVLFPTFINAVDTDGAANADAPYTRFATTRSAVLETEMDVLDLYTTHRSSTFAGAKFPLEEIMQVRIALNQIAERFAIPRHVNFTSSTANGDAHALQIQPAQYIRDLKLEAEQAANGAAAGTDGTAAEEKDPGLQIIAVKRFVLKPAHAVQEVQSLDQYYRTREEEYEREHEVSDGWETAPEDGGDADVKPENARSSGRGRTEGNSSSRKEDPSGSFRRKKR
jgi:CTD kinase subunit beta